VAAELAKQGYVALAIDLYGGKVTDDPKQARKTDGRRRPGGGWSLNASLAEPVTRPSSITAM
jgi:dienelactone hydrolase